MVSVCFWDSEKLHTLPAEKVEMKLETPSMMTGFCNTHRQFAGCRMRISTDSPACLWVLGAVLPKCWARWTKWDNGGMNVPSATNCFLIGLRLAPEEGTHVYYCKPSKDLWLGRTQAPEGRPLSAIVLLKWASNCLLNIGVLHPLVTGAVTWGCGGKIPFWSEWWLLATIHNLSGCWE